MISGAAGILSITKNNSSDLIYGNRESLRTVVKSNGSVGGGPGSWAMEGKSSYPTFRESEGAEFSVDDRNMRFGFDGDESEKKFSKFVELGSSASISIRDELDGYQHDFNIRLWDYGRLKESLDLIFEKETRDNDWASNLEDRVKVAAKLMPGFVLKKLECKYSLCRFEFGVEKESGPIFKLQGSGYFSPLVDALGADVTMNGTKDFYEWSGYLLNIRRADAYIDAFRNQYRMMNGAIDK